MKERVNMKQELLYGIVGLILGVVMTSLFVNNLQSEIMKSDQQVIHETGMGSSMDEMASSLQGKTGDDFDKVFIQSMIVHHEGAIEMANSAKQNAKHEEIKNLADDIIMAQTSEIEQMKQWQKEWGY